MKVMINGVEIEIRGSSRLTYDVERDTLSVDPISEKKSSNKVEKRAYTRKSDLDAITRIRSVSPAHEVNCKNMTIEELKTKIFDVIKRSKQPVAQQFVTLESIGKGSTNSERHYFAQLLQQLSESGELIRDNSSGRSRYSIP